MSDSGEVHQHLTLLNEEDVGQQKRISFWRGLFRRSEQDVKEDEGLLAKSCPNLGDFDDKEFKEFVHAKPLVDDDDDDDEEGGDEEYDEGDSKAESIRVVSDDDDDNDESGDDNSESSESDDESEEEEEEEEGDRDELADLAPVPARPGLGKRSVSYSSGDSYRSGFSDHADATDEWIDSDSRKRVTGRIQGIENTNQMPDIVSPRTFRQRISHFRANRSMRKMSIGTEEEARQPGLVKRIETKMINIVDSMLPEAPELDGYMIQPTTTKPFFVPTFPTHAFPTLSSSSKTSSAAGANTSGRRKALGDIDDATYIMFLECELQTSECQISAWKRRVNELEEEVAKLKGLTDDNSSSAASDASAEEVGESEIEWETGVAKEGILVDVDENDGTRAVAQKTPTSDVENEWRPFEENPSTADETEEGVLIQDWHGATVWCSLSGKSPTVGETHPRPNSDVGDSKTGRINEEEEEKDEIDTESQEELKDVILVGVRSNNDGAKGSLSQSELVSKNSNKNISTPMAGDCNEDGTGSAVDAAKYNSVEMEGSSDSDSSKASSLSEDGNNDAGPKEGVLLDLSDGKNPNNETTSGSSPQLNSSTDGQNSCSSNVDENVSDDEQENAAKKGPKEVMVILTGSENVDANSSGPLLSVKG